MLLPSLPFVLLLPLLVCSLTLPSTIHTPVPGPGPAPHLEARILGGAPVAHPTDFPYMAAMHEKRRSKQPRVFTGCSGIALSKTKILTAATCLDDAYWDRRIKVWFHVGALTHGEDGEGDGTFAEVGRIDLHTQHERGGFEYNVAIATLKKPLDFSDTIKAAHLVKSGTKKPAAAQILEVAGWGQTEPSGPMADTLQHAMTQAVDVGRCVDMYPHSTSNSFFCTIGKGQGAGKGDSGGPVVDSKSRAVVGLVSRPLDHEKNMYPSLVTDLADRTVRKWIQEELDRKG